MIVTVTVCVCVISPCTILCNSVDSFDRNVFKFSDLNTDGVCVY